MITLCHDSLPAVRAVSHFAMTRERTYAIAFYYCVNMSPKKPLGM